MILENKLVLTRSRYAKIFDKQTMVFRYAEMQYLITFDFAKS